MSRIGYERPAVAGSGTIACGLAACASTLGPVRLAARSDSSAWRAEEHAQGSQPSSTTATRAGSRSRPTSQTSAGCDLVVEAIVEDAEAKAEHLHVFGEACPDADLATTTSSLSVAALAAASGNPDRLLGLHVFNPPHRMELVELCLPEGLREGAADRVRKWCSALGKTVVEVPDEVGFVVNRLAFPYLFDAVRLMERTGMDAAEIDTCMRLGAGHPMGPLALMDFVGLDVSVAIGESLYAQSEDPAHRPPDRLLALVAEGHLGRKSGAGFFEY